MQITQELCKRPGLNKAGFEMPTIYIPTLLDKVRTLMSPIPPHSIKNPNPYLLVYLAFFVHKAPRGVCNQVGFYGVG